jgi:hypothetical protein
MDMRKTPHWHLYRRWLQVHMAANLAALAGKAGASQGGDVAAHLRPTIARRHKFCCSPNSWMIDTMQRLDNGFPELDRNERAESASGNVPKELCVANKA